MDNNFDRRLNFFIEEMKAIPPRTPDETDEDREALLEQAKAKARQRADTIEAAEAAEAQRWDAFDTLSATYLAVADRVDTEIPNLGAAVRDALAACTAAGQAFPGKSPPTLYRPEKLATLILQALARGIPKEIRIAAPDAAGPVAELVRGEAAAIASARGVAIAKAANAADSQVEGATP
jgi:hypothetical protein